MRKLFGTILFAAGAAAFFTMEGFAGIVTGVICIFIGIVLLFSNGGGGGYGGHGSDGGFFIGGDGGHDSCGGNGGDCGGGD